MASPADIDFPVPIRGSNFFDLDPELHRYLASLAPKAMEDWRQTLRDFGAWCGGAVDAEAEYTDRHGRPKLATYAGDGSIVNDVIYNPAWEAASREVYARGIVGLNYGEEPAPFLITFAMGYLLSQADVSLHCPVTMTGAVAYVLDRFGPEDVKNRFLESLIRRDGEALSGGTWATELHGGSDVGATTTGATPIKGEPGAFRLNGLKWFTSNAGRGLALATARPDASIAGSKGLGVYLVPTHLEDGTPNAMRIRRLKDKLGTVGIATGEIDLLDAWSVEVAPPPDGFKLMMEALEFSRIHNAMAAAGVTHRAFLEAVSFAQERQAFGNRITAYPMVQQEIMKLQARAVAGLALSLDAAHAFDRADGIAFEDSANPRRVWLRIVTALAKYKTAEWTVRAASRAIEVIGGNGYVYDRVTPRLLRDGQVLTVWEGPANIQALELLRLLSDRFKGFSLFEEEMDKLLDQASLADAAAGAELSTSVSKALQDCRAAARIIAGGEDLAQRHARRFLDLMSDTYAAARLLAWAAADWRDRGDRRLALIARFLIEEILAPAPLRGITQEADWLSPHFGDIICGRPIA